MGMFDSFLLKHQGREVEVQSKQFACSLQTCRLGDFVEFDCATPCGVLGFVEDFKIDYRDNNAPYLWGVIILLSGCFVDYLICDDEAEAQRSAAVMVKLWQQPERQADVLLRFASAHYARSEVNANALGNVAALLGQYVSWLEYSGKRPESWLSFHWRDFEETPWDVALAKILCGLDEFRPHLPKKYQELNCDVESSEPLIIMRRMRAKG
jgi:hypothetical protein